MANLKAGLLEYVEEHGEPLEAIVIGVHDRRRHGSGSLPDENVVLSVEDGLRKLDAAYDNGWGSADCYPFFAWTKSRVYFVDEYDGSTSINWLPRNPRPCEPRFSGMSFWSEAARG